MVSTEYANAYSEVLEILNFIDKKDYDKIPKEKIEIFETNQNKNYKFQYDSSKTLDEQNVSKIAKGIIAILFRDYWATEKQREKILANHNYNRKIMEQQKQQNYNVKDLFKNKVGNNQFVASNKSEIIENKNNIIENTALIEVKKENFVTKILDFFKKIFKK